jgi:hypothetical protein
MKKINVLLGFLISVLIMSCSDSKKIDLGIPDNVVVDTTQAFEKFPSTNIFIVPPPNYILDKQLLRFSKDDTTYIQIVQIPAHTGFEKTKDLMEQKYTNLVLTGQTSPEYYKKEFKLNGYNALMYYAPDDEKPGREQIVILFGDSTFITMAAGEMPADQPETRKEIVTSLLTLYVNKNVKIDPEAPNFTLDVSNTEFKFNSASSQLFFYTIGGKGDPTQDINANEIMLIPLPAMNDSEQIKSYSATMLDKFKNNGVEIASSSDSDLTINGNYAHEIMFEGTIKDKPISVCQVITSNQNSSVVFIGTLYDRQDQLMPQVIAIGRTLQLK